MHIDTSCILAWLIEQGYDVVAFMADVGQEEVCKNNPISRSVLLISILFSCIGLRGSSRQSTQSWRKEVRA